MTRSTYIRLVAEFSPILIFFVAGQFLSFIQAALVLVVSTILATVVSIINTKSVPGLPVVSAVFVSISGSITYFFNQPGALIIADSIYYFCIAAAIAVGLRTEKYVLKRLFSNTFAMTDTGWKLLSWRWFFMFFAAGIANEVARLLLTPEMWLNYRFATIIFISAFACYQFTLSRTYRIPHESNKWGLRTR